MLLGIEIGWVLSHFCQPGTISLSLLEMADQDPSALCRRNFLFIKSKLSELPLCSTGIGVGEGVAGGLQPP